MPQFHTIIYYLKNVCINYQKATVFKFVMAFTDQSNPITHSCWFAMTMWVVVLCRHQRWALHWSRLQGHVYGPSRWPFHRTLTPMEECTYSELILLCTFELEHCWFVLKMCDISKILHTRSTNGKYFEHIEFNGWLSNHLSMDLLCWICVMICCDELVHWLAVMFLWRLCICVYPLHNESIDGPSHLVLRICCFVWDTPLKLVASKYSLRPVTP
jgi:hypothetical protein